MLIDLGALQENYRTFARRLSPARCAAVVKANAYGLGVDMVAPALLRGGCTTFFVAQLCEAIALREQIGEVGEVFILDGLDPGQEALCAALGLVPVLNSVGQAERWRTAAIRHGKALPAALQIDSGMSRLGIQVTCARKLARDVQFQTAIEIRLIMTHLACADDPEHEANRLQLLQFEKVRDLFPGIPASVANSAASFFPGADRFDLVRPGIALYGSPPSFADGAMRPVVRLEAKVLQIRRIAAGTGVGYGLEFVASEPRRLATVGIGYADGWPRATGGIGAAWFAGSRLPIVGRVSMDTITVDISALAVDELHEGDFVELIGPSQSLDCVARDARTIPNEVLTGLGSRPCRVFLPDDVAKARPERKDVAGRKAERDFADIPDKRVSAGR